MNVVSTQIEGELWRGEDAVKVTTTEVAILRLLATNPGRAFSRLELSEKSAAGSERSVDVQITRLTTQNRKRPAHPHLFADGARCWVCAGAGLTMNKPATSEKSFRQLVDADSRGAVQQTSEQDKARGLNGPADIWRTVKQLAKRYAPRRLLTRSLLIIVTPVVLTQCIVTYIFFELHWNSVTSRLSEGVAGDIAMLIDTYERFPRSKASTG